MTLALFDLDNTLIGGDSDYLWGEFVVSKSLVDVEEYQRLNQEFYLDYVNGSLDVAAYLRFSMAPFAKI
jgi:phosphoserine phosphatase